MGETLAPIKASFNNSLQIEGRPERLSAESGALLLREADERLGLSRDLAEQLEDPRAKGVRHSFAKLLRTSVILQALGWRDQDDADFLRDDAAVRSSVSDDRGTKALDKSSELPSQPTLSRFHDALSSDGNRSVLRSFLIEGAARRVKARNGGHRQRYLTLDIDSIPVEVDGHQPGAEFNGHYGEKMFHPLIATAAEIGDILDVKLRPGNVHTAEGGLEFILDIVREAKQKICQVAAVRIDAGFPDDETLSGLEKEGVPYVARIKSNSVLQKLAEPYLIRPSGRPPLEGRTWTVELDYQAGNWTKSRRVVLVVIEKPGEIFLDNFFMVSSWTSDEAPAEELLDHYRQRGTAEGVFGELMDSIAPALSSNSRPKSHYRGISVPKSERTNLSYFVNEVRLILAAHAYNLAHVVRTTIVKMTGEGLRIKSVRDRYLRIASRFTIHARRIIVILANTVSKRWKEIWMQLPRYSF
jgi:hypothetical protein